MSTTITFLPNHQPAVLAGDYTVKVEQTLTTAVKNAIAADNVFECTRSFSVAGPRFTLDPGNIYTCFPPPGSLGDHSNVLPHITFYRSTLPWERLACSSDASAGWLALLVFSETEMQQVEISTVTKSALLDGSNDIAALNANYGELERWENGSDLITVIEVPSALLEIIPAYSDLELAAHVRDPDDADALAIVVANRLPASGETSTALLVSMEGLYQKSDDGTFTFAPAFSDVGSVYLVSLNSWQFSCLNSSQDFGSLLKSLDTGGANGAAVLRMPDAPSSNDSATEANAYVQRGYVPLNMYWREGATLVSWLHGPLIPGERELYDAGTDTTQTMQEAWNALAEQHAQDGTMAYTLARAYGFDLPAIAADSLVRYQQDTAMLDVSYAAAWQLGRLLALRDKAFSTGLYNWKRTVFRALKNAGFSKLYDYLPIYGGMAPPDTYALPEYQKSWLLSLSLLDGVPFNYLVPHESMLPTESIRFFKMDPLWIISLLDGAFSMGRTLASDVLHETTSCSGQMPAYKYFVSGFLLRSQVVSGWPDLVVNGYDDDGTVTILRQARLGEQVLLVLFDGYITHVEITQKSEALHFGFDHVQAGDGTFHYEKELRATDGTGSSADDNYKLDITPYLRTTRTIDLKSLADEIAQCASGPQYDSLNAGQFGFEMIEGVEAVDFIASPAN